MHLLFPRAYHNLHCDLMCVRVVAICILP